jgi:hypothetical protein
MAIYGYVATLPVLLLIFAISAFIALSFSRGRKKNRKISFSAFNDLIKVFKPDDHAFTNIGGLVGHHANFCFKEKDVVNKINATITLMPRHAPLYMPISKLIMRDDRLFITLYMRCYPPGEGHLIEKKYADFRGPKITNANRLYSEEVRWDKYIFYLYYQRKMMYDQLKQFIDNNPDPGVIRHMAILPDQRKGFIFMIPREGMVGKNLEPAYQFILKIFKN